MVSRAVMLLAALASIALGGPLPPKTAVLVRFPTAANSSVAPPADSTSQSSLASFGLSSTSTESQSSSFSSTAAISQSFSPSAASQTPPGISSPAGVGGPSVVSIDIPDALSTSTVSLPASSLNPNSRTPSPSALESSASTSQSTGFPKDTQNTSTVSVQANQVSSIASTSSSLSQLSTASLSFTSSPTINHPLSTGPSTSRIPLNNTQTSQPSGPTAQGSGTGRFPGPQSSARVYPHANASSAAVSKLASTGSLTVGGLDAGTGVAPLITPTVTIIGGAKSTPAASTPPASQPFSSVSDVAVASSPTGLVTAGVVPTSLSSSAGANTVRTWTVGASYLSQQSQPASIVLPSIVTVAASQATSSSIVAQAGTETLDSLPTSQLQPTSVSTIASGQQSSSTSVLVTPTSLFDDTTTIFSSQTSVAFVTVAAPSTTSAPTFSLIFSSSSAALGSQETAAPISSPSLEVPTSSLQSTSSPVFTPEAAPSPTSIETSSPLESGANVPATTASPPLMTIVPVHVAGPVASAPSAEPVTVTVTRYSATTQTVTQTKTLTVTTRVVQTVIVTA